MTLDRNNPDSLLKFELVTGFPIITFLETQEVERLEREVDSWSRSKFKRNSEK